MYRMTGFGKQFLTTPTITVRRRILISSAAAPPFHISISVLRLEDLNCYSIGKASLKSDLLIHLLFNVSLNS